MTVGELPAVALDGPRLIVNDDVEQGAVDLELAVVLDETETAELVHKETDSGSRGFDHLCEGFLTDVRYLYGRAFTASDARFQAHPALDKCWDSLLTFVRSHNVVACESQDANITATGSES